jgi:hypothetical protein
MISVLTAEEQQLYQHSSHPTQIFTGIAYKNPKVYTLLNTLLYGFFLIIIILYKDLLWATGLHQIILDLVLIIPGSAW